MWLVYLHKFPNDKYYIGITSKTAQARWGHEGHNYIRQKYLYNAIQKYGWDNIEHKIVAENLTEEEAKQMEMELIVKYNSKKPNGYNLTDGGNGVKGFGCFGEKNGMYGKHHSEETLNKISKAKKGKLTGKDNPFYGKHLSEEVKQKLLKANKGRKPTQEQIDKIVEKTQKMVKQINPNTNEVIAVYQSIKEAGETLNLDRGSISKCCQHKRKTVGGYIWEYVNTEETN